MSSIPIGSERIGAFDVTGATVTAAPHGDFSAPESHFLSPQDDLFEDISESIQHQMNNFDMDDDEMVLDVVTRLTQTPSASGPSGGEDAHSAPSVSLPEPVRGGGPTDADAFPFGRGSNHNGSPHGTPNQLRSSDPSINGGSGGGAATAASHGTPLLMLPATAAAFQKAMPPPPKQHPAQPLPYRLSTGTGSLPPPPNYAESLASAEHTPALLNPLAAAGVGPTMHSSAASTPPTGSLLSGGAAQANTPLHASSSSSAAAATPATPLVVASAAASAPVHGGVMYAPQAAHAPGTYLPYHAPLGAYAYFTSSGLGQQPQPQQQRGEAVASAQTPQHPPQQQQQQYVLLQQPSGQRLIYVANGQTAHPQGVARPPSQVMQVYQPAPHYEKQPPSYPQAPPQQSSTPQQQQQHAEAQAQAQAQAQQQAHLQAQLQAQQQAQMSQVFVPVQLPDGTTYQVPLSYAKDPELLQHYIASIQRGQAERAQVQVLQQQQQHAQAQAQAQQQQQMVYINGQLFHLAQLPPGATAAQSPQQQQAPPPPPLPQQQHVVEINGQAYVVASNGAGVAQAQARMPPPPTAQYVAYPKVQYRY